MNGKRVLAGGLLTSRSSSPARPSPGRGRSCRTGRHAGTDPPSSSGIAGPAGPQQISPVAAYFKRVTYHGDRARPVPEAGVRAARRPLSRRGDLTRAPSNAVDCLGVSFPLVPPHGANPAFTGYVTVAKSGDQCRGLLLRAAAGSPPRTPATSSTSSPSPEPRSAHREGNPCKHGGIAGVDEDRSTERVAEANRCDRPRSGSRTGRERDRPGPNAVVRGTAGEDKPRVARLAMRPDQFEVKLVVGRNIGRRDDVQAHGGGPPATA